MPSIPFAKGHGLGNDYIVLSRGDLPFDLSEASIVRICDRNWGIGSDGILMLVPSSARRLRPAHLQPRRQRGREIGQRPAHLRQVAARSRPRQARQLHGRDARAAWWSASATCATAACAFVTVEMGRATFRAPEIPMNGPDRDVVARAAAARRTAPRCRSPRSRSATRTASSSSIASTPRRCKRLGPLIERHPAFPQRTNVQFARVADRAHAGHPDLGARRRLHAGLRLVLVRRPPRPRCATGSATTAASPCACPAAIWSSTCAPDWSLRLEGPVEEVYTGALSAEFAEAWLTPATP